MLYYSLSRPIIRVKRVKEDEMEKDIDEKCIQDFGQKSWREENTWETYAEGIMLK
jgi:hypothetical protein